MKNKLLKFSFIISISGIFILLLFSQIIKPKQISDYQELKLNDYVSTTSKILSIKTYESFNIINLENKITLTCNSCNLKINQTITATGKVAEYNNKLQIQAEKIKIN